MNSSVLAHLTLTFELDSLTVRILYCYGGANPGPGTVSCLREVAGLTRDGLVRALKALGGESGRVSRRERLSDKRRFSLFANSLSSLREIGEGWSGVRRKVEALSGAIYDYLGELHRAALGKRVGH
jgi:hypothetical protein